MDNILNCGTNGWLMVAAGTVTYGVRLWPAPRSSNTSSPTAERRRESFPNQGDVPMAVTNAEVIGPATGGLAWLSGRRGVVIVIAVAAIAAAAALALSQSWLAVADLVPLLYVLPCAAMMFVCMRHGQQSDNHPPK